MQVFISARLELLDLIASHKAVTRKDILNQVGGVPLDVDSVLKNLVSDGYLELNKPSYSLTPKGREYRLALTHIAEQEHEQHAAEQAEKRISYKFQYANLLVNLFGIIAAMLCEHRFGIVDFILSFFR